MRAGYLGPPGTNSHDALVRTGTGVVPVPFATVGAVVAAVQRSEVDRGFVPLENSREGSVGATLDALVFDAPDVELVGEVVHRVRYCLAGAGALAPGDVATVHSHPQATGQCTRFLAERLPGAAVMAAASTADAVRSVAAGGPLSGSPPHAAIGTRHAVELYGAALLAEGIEDDPENATRFAWIARRGAPAATAGGEPAQPGSAPAATAGGEPAEPGTDPASTGAGSVRLSASGTVPPGAEPFKTALVFWGAGDVVPGWLVGCLAEFSSRGINLTRIESRPRRIGLGRYMFFCDLDGAAADPEVRAAVAGLRGHCEAVRVLGSFPTA